MLQGVMADYAYAGKKQANYLKALDFLFLNRPTTREFTPRQAEGVSIPRIIHQTYKSWHALPDRVRNNILAMKAANPDWEYRFYDNAAMAEFIRNEYGPRILGYYERIDPRYGAARADLFRYLVTYRQGGVYLDIKSSARRSLNEVLQPHDEMILAQWSRGGRFEGAGNHDWDFAGKLEGGEFQQWHLICTPGHPYLYSVIQAVLRNIDCYIPRMHGYGRTAVLRLSGPIAYSLAIIPLLPQNRHRLVTGHDDLGLEYSLFDSNTEHKTLFDLHYTDLTAPIVHASALRRLLSALYLIFVKVRGH